MGAFAKHPNSDSNEVRLVTKKYRYTNGEVQSQIDLFTVFALTSKKNQMVKYAASSFVDKALTWWNTQVQARGHEAAIGMSWTDFKALLVEELCPSNEMEKLESEF
ncbi:hypothetical protein Tco_0730453 [Tanacetum coccineum]|uniref:Retrotransposon gag domain-containing protein n=1 Tax=Tanacetum coccineum TaxID=301880 RepID=A0ABQ4YUJ1_9ASTR